MTLGAVSLHAFKPSWWSCKSVILCESSDMAIKSLSQPKKVFEKKCLIDSSKAFNCSWKSTEGTWCEFISGTDSGLQRANGPTPISPFWLFSLFSGNIFSSKQPHINLSTIRTRNVRIEGEHADHETTTTIPRDRSSTLRYNVWQWVLVN